MARVFITGSADGLGRAAAQTLLDDRHEVVLNVRNSDRVEAVRDLADRGTAVIVGDLADPEQTRSIARDVNRLGRIDAVIHNAGVYSGPQIMPVNIVAPYLLTAPDRSPAPARIPQQRHAPRWASRCGRRGLERKAPDRLLLGQQTVRHDPRSRCRSDLARCV